MTIDNMAHDPLEFVRNMWGRMGFTMPGMVTPTLDLSELEKRIGDMRAVEGWLKMNLSMLQMAIQGLEMQRAAIAAVHAMSQPMQPSQGQTAGEKGEGATTAGNNPFLWPWNMMSAKAEGEKKETPAASAPVAADSEKHHAKRKAAASDK
ncbi:MAG: hypothetical protein FWD67_00935 [Betaproteobacteria bacterium]|nr:hypothetical protein [Betaproteobacteria bacterium]